MGEQTKKIVQKKLGDDYVKTFIENEPGNPEYQRLPEQEQPTNATEDKLHYPELD